MNNSNTVVFIYEFEEIEYTDPTGVTLYYSGKAEVTGGMVDNSFDHAFGTEKVFDPEIDSIAILNYAGWNPEQTTPVVTSIVVPVEFNVENSHATATALLQILETDRHQTRILADLSKALEEQEPNVADDDYEY